MNFDKIIQNIDTLPALPFVVTKLIKVMNNPASVSQDLVDVISQDQSLTTKLLRLVNSSFYGFSQQVTTVSRAVLIIGHRAMQSLALGMSVFSTMEKIKSPSGLNKERFWEHSLACAACARLIALRKGFADPEEIFIAGLLHDIGKLLLDKYACEQYGKVIERYRNEQIPLRDLEKQVIGVTHTVLGELLLEKWGIPKLHRDVAAYHHSCTKVTDGKNCKITAVVELADTLSRMQGYGILEEILIEPLPREAMAMLDMREEECLKLLLELDVEIARAREFLGLGPEGKEKAAPPPGTKIVLLERKNSGPDGLKLILDACGYIVLPAETPAQAAELLRQEPPAALIVNEPDEPLRAAAWETLAREAPGTRIRRVNVGSPVSSAAGGEIKTLSRRFSRRDILEVLEL